MCTHLLVFAFEQVMTRSDDHGESWSRIDLVAGNATGVYTTAHGNVVPIVSGNIVHLIWCVNNTYVLQSSSIDDGKSWATPRNITDQVTHK